MGKPADQHPLTEPATLACPRCGYDLTPMVPPQGPARDAAGKCSECGLEFTWNGLFTALRQLLPGFVEHARGRWRVLTSIVHTWSWLVFPHRFWSRVTVERTVSLGRAFLWLLVAVGTLRLSETALILGTYAWEAAAGITPFAARGPTLDMLVNTYLIRSLAGWGDPAPVALAAGLFSLFAAIMLVVLPITRQRAKVRLTLVVRAWIYSHALLVPILLFNACEIVYSLIFVDVTNLWRTPDEPSIRIAQGVRASAEMREIAMPILLLVMLLWLAWYWYSALRLGWRVPQALVVTLAMVIPAALAVLTFLVVRALP